MEQKIFKLETFNFVKVRVYPLQSEDFYQLFKDGVATDLVFSLSHLSKCLGFLEDSL